jgi:hypothetical protein
MLGLRLDKANQIARRLWGIYFPKTDWRQHVKKQGVYAVCLGSYRKVRRPCSCWMCGNPRRHFGTRTRRELAAALHEQEGD